MSAALTLAARRGRRWALLRGAGTGVTVYLPIILMGLMALGTYWLARNTPTLGPAEAQRAAHPRARTTSCAASRSRPSTPTGRLKSEVHGTEARHYPDTDTLEIDQPRIRSFNAQGELTRGHRAAAR